MIESLSPTPHIPSARELVRENPTDYRPIVDRWRQLVKYYGSIYPDYRGIRLVDTSLNLSFRLHQGNEIVENRKRKVPVDGRYPPYIVHPLAATEINAGMKHEEALRVPGMEQPQVIRVRQHPYDPVTVSATAGHDLIEDVRIGDLHGDALAAFLESEFSAASDPETAADTMQVIRAVTNYEEGELPKDFATILESHPIFHSVVAHVTDRVPDADPARVRKQVATTIADNHRRYDTCFRNADGTISFSPHNVKQFFRASAVRYTEGEDNLATGVRGDKLVRAHYQAVEARIQGMPVASRIALQLVLENRYGISGGNSARDINPAEIEMILSYLELENRQKKPTLEVLDVPRKSSQIKVNAFQIPLMTPAEIASLGDRGYTPAVQMQCIVSDPRLMESLIEKDKTTVRVGKNFKWLQATAIRAPIHDALRQHGRQIAYFKVDTDEGKTAAIIQFRDLQPTAHDAIRYNAYDVSALDVPEWHFFERFDGSVTSTLDILSSFFPLNYQPTI